MNYQTLTVTVPPDTTWAPDNVVVMLGEWLRGGHPVILQIRTTPTESIWNICVPAINVLAIKNSIFATYPNSAIQTNKTTPDLGYYLVYYESVTPFIGPLKDARDARKQDPLTGLLGAFQGLEEGEEIVWEATVYDSGNAHSAIAQKLMTTAVADWTAYLRYGVEGVAKLESQTGGKVDKYHKQIIDIANAKLNQTLKDVRLCAKIKTSSEDRADSIARGITGALGVFEVEGMSDLVVSDRTTFPLVLTSGEIASLWHLPTKDLQSPTITWGKRVVTVSPPSLSEAEVLLGVNTFQGKSQTVGLFYEDRSTHVNIVGGTGMGKSTLLMNMICQDIAKGKGVGVIDPHGDLITEVLKRIPEHRKDDVVLFDCADTEYPIGLNMMTLGEGIEPEALATANLGVVKKLFAEQWSATRMEDAMYASLLSLLYRPNATLMDVPRLLIDGKFRYEVLQEVKDPVALEYWTNEYNPLSAKEQLETARPITTRIRLFYRNATLRRIIAQPNCLDFPAILNGSKIFLASLSDLGEVEKETLGALLIARLQLSAMARRDNRTPFYLYIDEVQKFVTTSLAQMFDEARKYGLSLTVANQHLQQLNGAVLNSVLGNAGTSIVFRVGPPDAKLLAPLTLPKFDAESLTALDAYEAVIRTQHHGVRATPFNIKTAPPLPELPTDYIDHIRQVARTVYATAKDDIDQRILNIFEREIESQGDSFFG